MDPTTLPPTKEAARALGLKRYFPKVPCVKGHVAARTVERNKCAECIRQRTARWFREHREFDAARGRVWQAANAEKSKQRQREWRAANRPQRNLYQKYIREQEKALHPERIVARRQVGHARRKARKMDAPGAHTAQDVASIRARQAGRCAFCGVRLGRKAPPHVDHIIALSKGGSNDPSNLQVLCQACNCRKGSKTPEEFARHMGLLI